MKQDTKPIVELAEFNLSKPEADPWKTLCGSKFRVMMKNNDLIMGKLVGECGEYLAFETADLYENGEFPEDLDSGGDTDAWILIDPREVQCILPCYESSWNRATTSEKDAFFAELGSFDL